MREDPNIEFGRLNHEDDFGFGAEPTEAQMMNEKLQNAFQGQGLFEEHVIQEISGRKLLDVHNMNTLPYFTENFMKIII